MAAKLFPIPLIARPYCYLICLFSIRQYFKFTKRKLSTETFSYRKNDLTLLYTLRLSVKNIEKNLKTTAINLRAQKIDRGNLRAVLQPLYRGLIVR